MASIGDRLRTAWNAFTKEPGEEMRVHHDVGASYSLRPDRVRLDFTSERALTSSIYTRIGIDVAAVDIRHARLDSDGRYIGDMSSTLNDCLTLEANLDQDSRAFMQDAAMTLCDKGVIAIVPVDVSKSPTDGNTFEIFTMRVGEVVAWYPRHVRVLLYNDRTGMKEEITVDKRYAAIVENPLYAVMNEPNSTLRRLIRKLALLDAVDEQSGSGKLDLIIQLPYVIKSDARREQAEQRRKDIEFQLSGSKYGIAYTDGTERITQLNRPTENNLMKQVEYLTTTLYNQLGLTAEIFNGTADERAMINYYNRTIEPLLAAITNAMKRTFLTKTARAQGQSIKYFRDPFKLVPVQDLAEIADKFTRNEIVTSNEFRSVIGFKPVKDPRADELRNSNMPQPSIAPVVPATTAEDEPAQPTPTE